ncbi:Fe-only nitrogenase accessory AnfO family protein [Clostridium sp. Marseille-P2415]|uniref:Fe-only nitrogenase accessory AnfO family protein n=1 Tax=Clostridium sp. Marseille-P2415 TaxID=1805471 RepID=UPI0009888075|nr:Fe-only nitrogenase accessory AnfO family protein [Clostridium sp. Marseille-P2415]
MDRIAVFSREKEIVSFVKCNMVDIYEKQDETWKIARTASFLPLGGLTVKELRKETEKIAHLAEEVKAVVCKEIAGIPFSVFNRKGCCIFSVEKIDDETLNGVITDIEESDEKERMKDEMIRNARPAETRTPGVYMLNLQELQKECPEISSKKALMPFLSNTPFLELHLICAHVPPWLERDASCEKRVQSRDGLMHVLLTKKQC